MSKVIKGFLAFWVLGALPGLALTGDRHFIYNYESAVLDSGEREIETYTTYRFGRGTFYSGLDQSLEFEAGLGGDVQASFYLNFTQEFTGQGAGPQLGGGPVLDGVSNEWKIKLADNSADAAGLGLYFEPEFEPDKFELETKVILDKKMGSVLAAFNFLAAPAYSYVDDTSKVLLRPSLGLGAFATERLFVGFESMDENFYDSQPMRSVFSLGPLVQYSGKDWWVALAYLPQIANIGGPSLDFTDSQRNQVRVASSFSL
jgi:hypothetical protein